MGRRGLLLVLLWLLTIIWGVAVVAGRREHNGGALTSGSYQVACRGYWGKHEGCKYR